MGVLAENGQAAQALAETAYPGQRRTAGTALDIGFLLGAPFLGILQDDPGLLAKNQSELSSSWTILGIAALLVVAAVRPLRASRHALLALGFILAGAFTWILYTWPEIGEAIPLMSNVPPFRLAAVIGIPATLAFALAIAPLWTSQPDVGRRRARLGLTLSIGTVLALLFAGSHLQADYLPELSSVRIALISLAAALGIALMAADTARARQVGAVVLMVGMAATVWRVSPVMDGLGDLRDSQASDRVVELAGTRSPEDGYWASDSWDVSALLTANGVPALTGDQWTGPTDLWRTLDPGGDYENTWNRGASVIYFAWDTAATAPLITLGRPDQILVRASPCDPALRELDLAFAVSATPLSAACLRDEGTIDYSGRTPAHLPHRRQPRRRYRTGLGDSALFGVGSGV